MKKTAKIILIIVLLGVIGGLVYYMKTKPLELKTFEVETGEIIKDFKETGTIMSKDVEVISAPISEKVLFVAELGSEVKEGNMILKFEDEDQIYDYKEKREFVRKDGIITKVFVTKGAFIAKGTPALEIVYDSEKYAKCEMLASNVSSLEKGEEVKIIQKSGQEEKEYSGEIAEIANFASTQMSSLGLKEQRVEVLIKADEFNDSILGSEVDVIFETMHLEDVVTVPKTSVFKEEEKDFVWVVKDGELAKSNVELGMDSDYDYEVVFGLAEGDIVVVDSNNVELEEGKKVK